MSCRVTIPLSLLNNFRATFHQLYPYDHTFRHDRVVLESAEGVHFHYPLQLLIDNSIVFSHASVMALQEDGIQPIVLTFAPAAALCYFLAILPQSSQVIDSHNRKGRKYASPTTIIGAVRIAHILEAPTVGRTVLKRKDLDMYLRYAIERIFDWPNTIQDDSKNTSSRPHDISDLSFSLNSWDQYEQSLELLEEINPVAAKHLTKFHHTRQNTISTLKQWLSIGIPLDRVLRSDRPTQVIHHRSCKARFDSGSAFARRLPDVVPKAMALLAKSKSKIERTRNIKALLVREAKGCSGCLTRLESVYMPALRSFDAAFTAVPK
jgi:hypothetical protein